MTDTKTFKGRPAYPLTQQHAHYLPWIIMGLVSNLIGNINEAKYVGLINRKSNLLKVNQIGLLLLNLITGFNCCVTVIMIMQSLLWPHKQSQSLISPTSSDNGIFIILSQLLEWPKIASYRLIANIMPGITTLL